MGEKYPRPFIFLKLVWKDEFLKSYKQLVAGPDERGLSISMRSEKTQSMHET